MILAQFLEVVIQCVEPCSRQHAGLPQGAAEPMLPAPSFVDEVLRTRQQPADRAAQPLRKVDPCRIARRRHCLRRHAGRGLRVEQARAIHVHRQPVLVRHPCDFLDLLDLPYRATATIDALLDDHEPRLRIMTTGIANGGFDVGPGEDPILAFDGPGLRPGQRRRPARLRREHMRHIGADDFVAGPAVHQHGDLIAHGPRRQEDGGFLAELLGNAILQRIS